VDRVRYRATGEFLAMVNAAPYTRTIRYKMLGQGLSQSRGHRTSLEPGSAIKPFFVAAASVLRQVSRKHIRKHRPGY